MRAVAWYDTERVPGRFQIGDNVDGQVMMLIMALDGGDSLSAVT